MIKIECKGCNNSCCQNPNLVPVLLPTEEERFKKESKKIKTEFGDIFVLTKKENESCIFLNDETKTCTIYTDRPLECNLYPFLLNFENNTAEVKLDQRFCPHLDTLTFDNNKITDYLKKYHFPEDWIKKYNTLTDF